MKNLTPTQAARLLRLASYAAVAVALTLVAAKFIAWRQSGSVALLSSLADSALDALASAINLLAIRQALTPADDEHRFGHGKAEALAGLGQAALVALSAVFLGSEAIPRLFDPQPVGAPAVGIVVMGFSILLTLLLVLFQAHVIRNTASLAVSADSLHYAGDLLSNGVVLAALLLATQKGFDWVDPVGALFVAAFILYSAIRIFLQAFQQLMDRELPEAERKRIQDTVLLHSESRALHDLRTRQAGSHIFIQFHLELDPELSLRDAHRIAVEIQDELLKLYPGAQIIIHEDPHGQDEPHEDVG